MTSYEEWSHMYPQAAEDLEAMLTTVVENSGVAKSEAWAQQNIRMQMAKSGALAWRNNVGATPTKIPAKCPLCQKHFEIKQRHVRYGLCNDSKRLNDAVKSSDLIGIIPRVIKADMVGSTIGQFAAIEVKKPGWKYTGYGREAAQQAFLSLVASHGGYAKFSTGEITR